MRAQLRTQLRRLLDQRLAMAGPLAGTPPPAQGWLRAAREALGMTAAQVASRMNVLADNIYQAEAREVSGALTLSTMEKQARAMGCRVVCLLVPAEASSFEGMVDAQAHRVAERLAKRTSHTMKLEDQQVSADEESAQRRELTESIKAHWRTGYWDAE